MSVRDDARMSLRSRVRGKFFELNGYYRTCRRFEGLGRLCALTQTLLHGWTD